MAFIISMIAFSSYYFQNEGHHSYFHSQMMKIIKSTLFSTLFYVKKVIRIYFHFHCCLFQTKVLLYLDHFIENLCYYRLVEVSSVIFTQKVDYLSFMATILSKTNYFLRKNHSKNLLLIEFVTASIQNRSSNVLLISS